MQYHNLQSTSSARSAPLRYKLSLIDNSTGAKYKLGEAGRLHRKTYNGRAGHCIYSVNGGNNWGGDTSQHWKKKTNLLISNWCGGWFQLHNIATLWLHLASWNLPDFQYSWESRMELECGNNSDTYIIFHLSYILILNFISYIARGLLVLYCGPWP